MGPLPTDGELTADAIFTIAVNGRPAQTVTVTAASTQISPSPSLQNLVEQVNAALKPVNADLQSAGLALVTASAGQDGSLVFTTSGFNASITISGGAGASAGLGIGATQTSAPPMVAVTGSNDVATQVQVTALTLTGTINVTGTVDANAFYGASDLTLTSQAVSFSGGVTLTEAGSHTLAQLVNAGPAITQDFYSSLTGSASVTLSVAGYDAATTALLGLDANAAITLNSGGNLFNLTGWTADTSALEGVVTVAQLTFAQVSQAIGDLGSALTELATTGELAQQVPLLGISLGSVLDFAPGFVAAAKALAAAAPTSFTVDQLAGLLDTALETGLGLASGQYVTVGLSGTSLTVAFNVSPKLPSAQLPIDINLAGLGLGAQSTLPGVTTISGGEVTVTPTAALNIKLDIDLSSPTSPVSYLDGSSTFAFGLLLTGSASGSLAIGPLGVLITGGAVSLGSKADSTKQATIGVSFAAGTRYRLSDLINGYDGGLGGTTFQTVVDGAANLSLDLSTSSGAAGTLSLAVPDLGTFLLARSNGSSTSSDVSFAAPDLSATFKSADLLGSTSGVVNALNTYLDDLQKVLVSDLFGQDIPLLGDALGGATAAFADGAGDFIQNLKTMLDNDSELASATGLADVQKAMFDLLNGLGILLPQSGSGTPAQSDIVITYTTTEDSTPTTYDSSMPAPMVQDVQNIEFNIKLGGTEGVVVPITGDLGLPGLNIGAAKGTSLDASLIWSLPLDFGIDRGDGLYIESAGNADDLNVEVKASLAAGSAFTAQLGLLTAVLSQPSTTAADPVDPSMMGQATEIDLTFVGGFSGGQQMITLGSLGSGLPGFGATFGGSASVGLDLSLGFGLSSTNTVDTQYPHFVADLLATNWTFGSGTLDGGAAPDVQLHDIQLDFGSFLNGYIKQVLGPIDNILQSIEPIINVLTTPLPVINEDLLDLASDLGGDVQGASQFLSAIAGIIQFAQDFSGNSSSGNIMLHFGDVDFGGIDLRHGLSGGADTIIQQISNLGGLQTASASALDSEADADNPTFGNDLSAIGGGLAFPILDNPNSLLDLLFGKDVTLFTFVTPKLSVGLDYSISIPIPAFPLVALEIDITFDFTARLGVGYDTYGIREALADPNVGNLANDLADGFYLDESIDPTDGLPVTEVGLSGGIGVGGGIDLGFASFGVGGAIDLSIALSAITSAPAAAETAAYHEANDNDGKARLKEIEDNIEDGTSPLCAFNLDASVSFRLYVYVSALFYSHTFTIADVTLYSFSEDVCPPTSATLGVEDPNTGILTLYTPSDDAHYYGGSASDPDKFEVQEGRPGEIIVHADGASETFENVTGIVADLSGNNGNSLIFDSALTQADGTTPINETVAGGPGADTIKSEGGNDLLSGGGGNDEIDTGSTGNDTIYAGIVGALPITETGNATLNGSNAGYNLIYGGNGNDVITGAGTGNTIYGGPGNDTIQAGPGDTSMSINGDSIAGGGGGDLLLGGNGNDTIEGDGGANLIIGGNGANAVYGGVAPGGYSATALALYGNPATQPEGSNLIFGGTADKSLLNAYNFPGTTSKAGTDLSKLASNDPAGATDGNDTITAGTGGDQVFGGFKQNLINGGGGQDTLVGATIGDTIYGGAGNSLIYGRGTDTIGGGAGNTTIYGGPGHSTIQGDSGNDLIVGGNAGNTIYGGTGNDTIYAGDGADTVLGGSGDDLIFGQRGDDLITGGSGNSTLYGNAGDDTITGGSGNDYIFGDDGNDVLLGGTGNSSIYGGPGTDTMHGGEGDDYISGVGGNDDSVFGGSGNDTILGGGADDTISGGEGNDLIQAGTGPAQITGGSGNSTITGGAGFDVILGGTGNDSIQGGSAGDAITGGSGRDTITGGSAADTIYAGSGASLLTGGTGPDLLVGGVAADTIIGGTGDATIYAAETAGNVLTAGSGSDIIHGSGGEGTPGHGDTITGGSGPSTIYGSAGDDSIQGGSGTGEIDVGGGDATVIGGLGALLIVGGAGNDLLEAGLAAALDTIMGGRGNDTITGNAGADALYGGYGLDSISGGSGASVIEGGHNIGKTIYGGTGRRHDLCLRRRAGCHHRRLGE